MKIKEVEVEKIIKTLKKKKAGDQSGWRNEMIIEGGEEMKKCLTKLFNQILQEQRIPVQWEQMSIKTIHKKGSKLEMSNKRGIFLTNVLSKLFEKIIDHKTQDTIKMSEYQCGGKKERSTADNLFMLMTIINTNRKLNKNTYLIFADAVKCFDKLWLKDTLVDLNEAGMREREVNMIYLLNKKAKIVIDTPVGLTNEIEINEIVKQGTIFGPKFCCVSTDKINTVGSRTPITYIKPDLYMYVCMYACRFTSFITTII